MKDLRELLHASVCLAVLAAAIAPGTAWSQANLPDTIDEGEPIHEGEDAFIPLDPNDPSFNAWRELREGLNDREPGLIDVQRFAGHYNWVGIPTFFHMPIALTPADLAAGQVDVAIMGAESAGDPRARSYGPAEMRNPRNQPYIAWGSFLAGPMHTLLNPFDVLTVADYGDAPNEVLSVYRTMNEVRKYVRDIASTELEDGTNTIPFIVGGSHALEYPNVAGLVDVYGVGNVGVIHFDAHADTSPAAFGHLHSHGNPVYKLINEGLIPGENYIQLGLRGYYMDEAGINWMRENNMRYHTMVEIEARGWDAVVEDAVREAREVAEYIHISFDIDVVDPAYAPGTYTPEPGGMTSAQAINSGRRLCAESNVVGFDIVELKPESDPTYRTIQAAHRIMHSCLDGIALRKEGITDPNYLNPLTLDDNR